MTRPPNDMKSCSFLFEVHSSWCHKPVFVFGLVHKYQNFGWSKYSIDRMMCRFVPRFRKWKDRALFDLECSLQFEVQSKHSIHMLLYRFVCRCRMRLCKS